MAQPTRNDLDQAVEESMQLFRRARVSSVPSIQPRHPHGVLLALDGSSQDALTVAMARQFRERFQCSLTVVDARETAASDQLAATTAEALAAVLLPKATGDSYEQILAAVEQSRCDLLVVPSPFGRDLQSVGPDSVGTVIDVLLARSPVPVLIVREPYQPEGELFRRVRMILTGENEAACSAAAWATGLIGSAGTFQLILLLERETCENMQALMQSIAPEVEVNADSLSQALATAHVRLHRGLQEAAAQVGFQYQLRLLVEGQSRPPATEEQDVEALVVLALERGDHASQGGVQGRIRRSRSPVLVVCQGGK